MDAVYPAAASALARGRRLRRADRVDRASRAPRYHTQPVTFAEIKEVDEESEEACASEELERRRQRDLLDERVGLVHPVDPWPGITRSVEGARPRRRSRRTALHEPPDEGAVSCVSAPTRAHSEPSQLHATGDEKHSEVADLGG